MLERVLVAPLGAPDPGAPPCMRQRFLPWTDGDLQDLPVEVLAPQRGLASIGSGVAFVSADHLVDLRRPATRARSLLSSMIGMGRTWNW